MAEGAESDKVLETFLILRRHLKIAHHIPGRIRLRVAASVFKDLDSVDGALIDKIIGAIAGIKEARVNAVAGSIVIQYATKQIKPNWWETLLKGEEHQATVLLNSLLENELAGAVEAAQGA